MGWPADLTWYKLLTDWGSFIGGGAALIAGVLAFIATRQATNRQIAALARKDRLQARYSGRSLPRAFGIAGGA